MLPGNKNTLLSEYSWVHTVLESFKENKMFWNIDVSTKVAFVLLPENGD
jgi:hypothetical protein